MKTIYANVTAHPDRHGVVRYRFRKAGYKSTYINAEPDTPEFKALLQLALDNKVQVDIEELREEKAMAQLAVDIATLRHDRTPMIYIIGPLIGPVKIGYSTNLRSRLIKLQTSSPVKLFILGRFAGSKADEADLHARFSAYRLYGEWFKRAPEIEALMDRFWLTGLFRLDRKVR